MDTRVEQQSDGKAPEHMRSGASDVPKQGSASGSPEGVLHDDGFFASQEAEFREHQRRMERGMDAP